MNKSILLRILEAFRVIFRGYTEDEYWLSMTVDIQEQTIQNLKDTNIKLHAMIPQDIDPHECEGVTCIACYLEKKGKTKSETF